MTPAPSLVPVSRVRYQVHEGFAGFQTAERSTFGAVQQLESKLSVKFDGTSHVTDGEGHCTDVLDHPSLSPVAPCQRYNTGRRQPCASKGFPSVSIRIDGTIYEHDVVIDGGRIRKRKKKPSKRFRDAFGHTPLSVEEEIPWKCRRLVIGTGTGALPVMEEVKQEAKRRKINLVVLPTAKAIEALKKEPDKTNAILHVTC
jgi:hypothetical protein